MIPSIEDILADLMNGRMTFATAKAYIEQHLQLAQDNTDLRDHFAAKAMQGLLAKNGSCHPADAYDMADAMLKARAA